MREHPTTVAAKKKSNHSKRNRNIKSALGTIKNKLENLQAQNGGHPNYLLILEDNFSEVSATGPKTRTNRKIIVTAAGQLKEEFKNHTIGYDPEKMIVMKKGKTLEQDFSFVDEYVRDRVAKPRFGQAVEEPTVENLTPQTNSLISILQTLTKDNAAVSNKRGKLSKKRLRKSEVLETSSDDSSELESESSEEPKRKRRKVIAAVSKKRGKPSKKRPRKSKVFDTSSDDSSELESEYSEQPRRKKRRVPSKPVKQNLNGRRGRSDKHDSRSEVYDLDTNSDEEDNDPEHGTIQKSKKRKEIVKKPVPKQPKQRKEKHDVLKFSARKVLTPGSEKEKATDKSKAYQPNPPRFVPEEVLAAENLAANKDTEALELLGELATMPPNMKVASWLKKPMTSKPKPNQSQTNEQTAKHTTQSSKLVVKKAGGTKPLVQAKPKSKPKESNPTKQNLTKTNIPTKPSLPGPAKVNIPTKPSLPGSSRENIPTNSRNNKENIPTDNSNPGPSGQFRFGKGRGSQLVEESLKPHKPVVKKLFTPEDIQKHLDLDQTPTRKK